MSVNNFQEIDYISLVTDKKTGKRMRITEFEKSSRARRGLMILKEIKSNPYHVLKTFAESNNTHLILQSDTIETIKITELPILDRYSIGGNITKKSIKDINIEVSLVKNDTAEINIKPMKEKTKISLKEIDDRLLTIDDFL